MHVLASHLCVYARRLHLSAASTYHVAVASFTSLSVLASSREEAPVSIVDAEGTQPAAGVELKACELARVQHCLSAYMCYNSCNC
jgi:hypothetical protein